jgi:hypothetical protein
MGMRKLAVAFAALVGASALAAGAHAANLLVNGDFETGDFTGWTETDQAFGSGSWFIAGNGTGSPLNGFPTPSSPTGGTWNAQTDQGSPGSHTLSQTFHYSGGFLLLSFDAFAFDAANAAPVGYGTDFNGDANQHVQIDLTPANASGPLVFYGTFSDHWETYLINLTPLMSGAGDYTLAFTEVDNQLFYNVGLDNISVAGGAPEPAAWALMLGGFGLAGAALRRRKAAVV